MRGRLISFEGLDGVGKTTQIVLVKTWLEDIGHTVQVVREPGGTNWGERIRQVLLDHHEPRDPMAEFLLFSAARAELVQSVILPRLDQGCIVLADRYADSSEVYQGFGGGADLTLIRQINAAITNGASPVGTLWLDGPARLVDRVSPDAMESRGSAFFRRVHLGYQRLYEREPQRIRRIAADRSIDEVSRSIRAAIADWLSERT